MNNIEILENCWLMKTNHVLEEENKKVRQAIENLIQENKELKEENNKLKTCDGIFDVFRAGKESSRQRIEFDYIPKSKVKDKIEEKIKQGNYRTSDNPSGRIHFQKEITDYQIEVLQELLKEGE